MRFKRIGDNEPTLGIAPLVDIVFLLLIFFMVTSHFDVASGIKIRLPKAAQRILNQDSEKITLLMDRLGKVYFKGKQLNDEALQKELRLSAGKKDIMHLVLQADKDTKLGRVVQIMDLAKMAGIRSIIIAARLPLEGR
ncbi:MAG: biopolymer transporter ExbD [Desulfatiglandaceae bacterium]|jgi:biopolymer transport protein ExbD